MEALKFNITRALHQTGREREATLALISDALSANKDNKEVIRCVVASNLIDIVAKAIKERDDNWAHTPAKWVYSIVYFNYLTKTLRVPLQQTNSLVEAVVEKLRACTVHVDVWTNSLQQICNSMEEEELLSNVPLYDTLKFILTSKSDNSMKEGALSIFTALTNGNDAWQNKVLQDKQLLNTIVDLHDVFSQNYYFWGLMLNISQNEDAKTLLPKEVTKLAKEGTYEFCPDIYAILCDEETATQLKISYAYLDDKVKKICNLLNTRHLIDRPPTEEIRYTLLDLLRPLANLSRGDGNKVLLGQVGLVVPLLDVLQIDEKDTLCDLVKKQLNQSKITASEALWNLAFNKIVCEDIIDREGVTICNNLLEKIQGPSLLRKNLSGIIYMCKGVNNNNNNASTPVASVVRHIMISYQWAAQDLVKNISTKLRKEGYKVWLDLDEMRGSILDSMAAAIESAEVVLMCVSQKYKDSANCKFEAEYAAKRKVPIIPLKMQQDYDPDGWLGIILGYKLYYAFHDEQALDTNFPNLLGELGERGKGSVPPISRSNSLPSVGSSSHSPASSPRPLSNSSPGPCFSPPSITVSPSPSTPPSVPRARSASSAASHPPRPASPVSPVSSVPLVVDTSHPYHNIANKPHSFSAPSLLLPTNSANIPPISLSPKANRAYAAAHTDPTRAHAATHPASPPVPPFHAPPAFVYPSPPPTYAPPVYPPPGYIYTPPFDPPSSRPYAFAPPPVPDVPLAHPSSSVSSHPTYHLPLKVQFQQTAEAITKKIQILEYSLSTCQDPNEVKRICAAMKECFSVLRVLNK